MSQIAQEAEALVGGGNDGAAQPPCRSCRRRRKGQIVIEGTFRKRQPIDCTAATGAYDRFAMTAPLRFSALPASRACSVADRAATLASAAGSRTTSASRPTSRMRTSCRSPRRSARPRARTSSSTPRARAGDDAVLHAADRRRGSTKRSCRSFRCTASSAMPAGNNIYKIVPDATARSMPGDDLPDRVSRTSDEIVTQVIQVKNVNAAQLVPILRSLVNQNGHLAAYPPSNILIISDRAANVNRIQRIIGRIDQAGDSDVEIVPLQNASAADVVRNITQLFQQQQAQEGGGASPMKMVADDRSNAVLVSGDPSQRLRVKALIALLDTPLSDRRWHLCALPALRRCGEACTEAERADHRPGAGGARRSRCWRGHAGGASRQGHDDLGGAGDQRVGHHGGAQADAARSTRSSTRSTSAACRCWSKRSSRT